MASPLPSRAPRDPDLAVLALGLTVLAAIVAVDWALSDTVTLTPWVLIAPMFIATRGSERETAVIAVISFAVSIALGAVNDTFGESIHLMHMALVFAGGTLAVITARIRRRLDAERRRTSRLLDRERAERVRQELASRASGLLEAPLDSMTMLAQVAGLAVPDMADLCIVDLLEPDGAIKGVAVIGADPSDAEALRESRLRYPLDPGGEHPVAVAARTGKAELLSELPEENLSRYAASDEHFALMRKLHYRSAMVVPLSARGRTLGVLSLLRFRDVPYDEQDFAVARDLARRAALAVDNARLFSELRQTEGQLEAILANLSEAVTVQDSSGELVYANQAAAAIMGSDSPEQLLATPVADIAARFWQFDEEGKPFPQDAYPGRLALRGERPESVVMRQVDRATGEERWVRLAATPIAPDNGDSTLSVTVTEDITDVVHIARRQRFLSSASKLLTSSLDVEATIEKVAWAVIPDFADWCAVHLPDDQGRLRRVAVAHMGRGGAERFEELAQDLLRRTAPGESQLETVAEEGAPDEEVLSAAIVPLVAPGERETGAIVLVSEGRGRSLGPADVSLMEELGRRAGVAVANARVHAARSHIATTLQRSLLPPRLPVIPGLEIAARFRAAGVAAEVGGDFYDLFPAEDGWMIVIGDVTGKGPGAAAITSLARYTMRTAAMYERTPEKVLGRLNEVLLSDPERRQLCTAVALHIAPDGDAVRLRVACAGHPAPYLLRPGHDPEPAGPTGTLLGAFDDVSWEAAKVDLHKGESIVLYTDGVTDTRGEAERFGQDRLKELLARCVSLAPDDVASSIDAALLEFEEGPQRDDVALLVLRATGNSR
jgi:PAS domain S-box-containing protein